MFARMREFFRLVATGIAVASLLALSSCTGTYQSAGPPNSTVSMSAMTPSSVTLMTGQSQQFNVSVTGASNASIQWSIFGSNSGGLGTISNSGLYTAPSSVDKPGTVFTLYAGAAADTSVSRQAQITVNPTPPPVSVTITPSAKTVQTGATVQFTAAVSNATNTTVMWGLEVNGQSAGSIYGTINPTSGLYTAPNSVPNPANVTVVATSNQDSTKSGSATVTVIAAGTESISVAPQSDATHPIDITAGASQNFTATVLGLQDQAVTWQAPACSASGCGSVAMTGPDAATYTAPNVTSNLSVTLTATADADATQQAISYITVVPPVAPSLDVTCSNCSTTTPIAPNGGTATLNAQVMNLPSGWTLTAINWASPGNKFCISTDDPGDADDNPSNTPTPDNCVVSGISDLDGPGTISGVTNGTNSSQATYKAPAFVSVGTGTFVKAVDVGCNNGSDTDTTRPWVYVPVQASLLDSTNGTHALQAFVCLRVGGTQY